MKPIFISFLFSAFILVYLAFPQASISINQKIPAFVTSSDFFEDFPFLESEVEDFSERDISTDFFVIKILGPLDQKNNILQVISRRFSLKESFPGHFFNLPPPLHFI